MKYWNEEIARVAFLNRPIPQRSPEELAASRASNERIAARKRNLAEYCETLPETVAGFERRGVELFAECGSYAGFVPHEAAAGNWPLAQLEETLNAEEECYD